MKDYSELVRRLRAVSTTEISTMYELTREAAKAIEALQSKCVEIPHVDIRAHATAVDSLEASIKKGR